MSFEAIRIADIHHKGCFQLIDQKCPADFESLFLACHEPLTLAGSVASAHLRHIRVLKSRDIASPKHNAELMSRVCLPCMETGSPQEEPFLKCH